MSRTAYDDHAGPPAAAYRFLDEDKPPHVRWLWPQRIPLGCLTLLIGDPAVGKSLLTADLAARLTVPHPWPDNPEAERPDPAKLPPLPAELTDEAVYRSFPPIRGFPAHEIAPTGVLFAAPEDVAALPDRLAAMARYRGVAILAVGHFTKAPARRAFYRIRGSLSLVAAARSVLLLTSDPDQPDRRILTQIKNAYGPPAPPLAFRIVSAASQTSNSQSPAVQDPASLPGPSSAPSASQISNLKSSGASPAPTSSQISNLKSPNVPDPASSAGASSVPSSSQISNLKSSGTSPAPHLEWADPSRPDWRLSTGVLDLSPECLTVLSEACDWLTDLLTAGQLPAVEVLTAARAAGIPTRTLYRAKTLLNIQSRKIGTTWTWLPPPGAVPAFVA